jgi:hypothetical protein
MASPVRASDARHEHIGEMSEGSDLKDFFDLTIAEKATTGGDVSSSIGRHISDEER